MLADNPQILPLKTSIFRNFEEWETLHLVYHVSPKDLTERAFDTLLNSHGAKISMASFCVCRALFFEI
jgi:hypothetical protein